MQMARSTHTPNRELERIINDHNGVLPPNYEVEEASEFYRTAERTNNIADEYENTYLNQYSVHATALKNAPRIRLGLPLSNNEMHLMQHHVRDPTINSPTVSRYSAAIMPQSTGPQYPSSYHLGQH